MGYRVTDEGGVIAPSGRSLLTTLSNKGYYHFSLPVRKVDCEKHGLTSRMIRIAVHRLAAYQLFGEDVLKDAIQVRHLNGDRLDNRLINIAIGTQSENSMDRPEHARKAHAAHAGSYPKKKLRKLTNDQAREIRIRFDGGESARVLAKAFAVVHGTINNIVYGRTYKDVV